MTNGSALPFDPGCFWHGPEEIPADAYLVCGECGHVFATEADLERVIRETHQDVINGATRPEYRPGPLPDVINVAEWDFCPYCAHSF